MSHASSSRESSVYCGIRNVYCCFTKVGVKGTNGKFSPCKYTWPLGSCGNCLEASDFDISWALCKDTIRSALTLAYSPGSSHRIPWQLAGDSWVGSQEVLGSCRSFMTAIGRGGDFETVLHVVVVPGHTC